MIVVVGAGAAGLVASIFARTHNGPVTVVERTADGGRKILISGGGRCNVLPESLEPRRFVSDSSAPLVRRLLQSWPVREQHAFFERDVGVPLALEAESRKWFPASNKARDVRDGLIALARARGVAFQFNTDLVSLRRSSDGWIVETSRGDVEASVVILATGGLSVPLTGSTGDGLRLAAALGHVVHDTYPALTPLVVSPPRHANLSGLSLDVSITAKSAHEEVRARGGFLFTHRGYSGPAVLDVSHVAIRSLTRDVDRATLAVQWCEMDERAWHAALIGVPGPVVNVLAGHLPRRLAEQLVVDAGLPLTRLGAELRRDERMAVVDALVRYALPWTGDEGYKKAEVTGGGVALDEIDPKTLGSRRQPSLFLCGELLDAFGPIGGHNFSWAWATGRLAGLGAAAQRRSAPA